jgi:hypothetical protein
VPSHPKVVEPAARPTTAQSRGCRIRQMMRAPPVIPKPRGFTERGPQQPPSGCSHLGLRRYRAGAAVRFGTLDEWWWRIIQLPFFFSNTKVYRDTQTSGFPFGSVLKW